jgi:putative ABC transport system permease protein
MKIEKKLKNKNSAIPSRPPCLASWLLRHVAGFMSRASIVGDYEEIYQELAQEYGSKSARTWFWSQVLKSLPMFAANLIFGSIAMLKNYVKLAYRNIVRHKRYALLNIIGLAVGLAACLLMASYVIHELSFETMHPLRDRIYRVNGRVPMGDRVLLNAVVGAPFGPTLEEALPEIEESVRILRRRHIPVRVDNRDFRENKMFFAEKEMLQVFSIPLLQGNRITALEAPFTVIIDETLARKYFGDRDPLGSSIRLTLDKTYDFQVTGIMKNLPSNTVIRTPMVASFATLHQTHREAMTHWDSWGMITTFFLISEGTNPALLDEKITDVVRSHLAEDEKEASYYLQALDRIYIDNATYGMNNDLDTSGSLVQLYIFSAVALLILIIAAINFINLSTAKIAGRMKEVGIRKTCGAVRSHLIKQFLMESVLITSIAMTLGLVLFSLFKPRLDQYLGKTLNLGVLTTPWILPAVAVMVLVVGFLAGSYPALFLSRFPAAVIFRSGVHRGPSKSGLRRVLAAVQFFIAGVLIVCTMVVLKQVRYSETKDLGYNKDNLIVLNNRDSSLLKKAGVVKSQILGKTGALNVSIVDGFPSGQNRNISTIRLEGNTEADSLAQSQEVDADFVPTMGLQILAGRNFEFGRAADDEAVLINETAAKSFGLDETLGKFLYREDKAYRIIGILKDWNTNSIHSPIYPMVLFPSDDTATKLVVRLPGEGATEIISRIREVITGLLPGQIFDYAYVDDLHLRAYDEERRLASLLISFCELTILVACLGIFGLSAYSAEQRTKEIGIRKVLGSSVSNVIFLLTRNYVRWVIVANIFAWPAAYFVANQWLQSFSFRTSVSISPFILAAVITLAVALLSVILQTLRAATANPVHSLRYE